MLHFKEFKKALPGAIFGTSVAFKIVLDLMGVGWDHNVNRYKNVPTKLAQNYTNKYFHNLNWTSFLFSFSSQITSWENK